jgi:hypothetical protein
VHNALRTLPVQQLLCSSIECVVRNQQEVRGLGSCLTAVPCTANLGVPVTSCQWVTIAHPYTAVFRLCTSSTYELRLLLTDVKFKPQIGVVVAQQGWLQLPC